MASDPIRILIVDDDEGVLIEPERLLEGEGYNTVTAWSAREAMALGKRHQFHLLLVDEHLADIDGPTLFHQLQRTQSTASCLLMHTRQELARKPMNSARGVCKGEHADMKIQIRSCLAA
jgi:DNA-binding NtrC family response regulator